MKGTSLLLFLISYFASFARSLSSLRSDLFGNCLNCINSGFDFCSLGQALGPIDPISGVCCQNMASVTDTCFTGNNACTWKTTTLNKFNKFFSCRKNSRCIVQPGISDYIVAAFNT
jgi:hypothetical protein